MILLRFALSLTIATITLILSVEAQTATAPSAGDGSIGDPYQIATLNNLYWITQNNTEWDMYYIQTADIDASSTSGWNSGSGFTPIGNGSASFTGSYDGGSYTISGLYISRSGTDYIGLFGFISDATVKNIKLVNVNFNGNSTVGGIVGFSTGSGSALIEYCSSTGTITGTANQIGGLIGKTQAGTTVRYCYSTTTVSTTNGNYLGGFVGHNDQSSTISNCFSRGDVSSANGNQVGGFVGVNQSATVTNCYSVGNATNGGGSFVGGFVGAVSGGSISNSLWDTEASGNATSVAGTGKTTSEMKTQSTYTDAGWDFTTTWEMVGSNYPRLQGIPDEALPVELVLFSVIANGRNTELKWKTATEVNNYGFEVERSPSPTPSHPPAGRAGREGALLGGFRGAWVAVGFVEGNGTTNAPKEYSFIDKDLSAGKYSYRLRQIDRDGKFSYSQEVEVMISQMPSRPAGFTLMQNYPNPFNPTTTIGFTLQVSGMTSLKIYDAIGREVATLVNENLEAGVYHQRIFDASQLASGIYFTRLQNAGKQLMKKMLLLK